MRNAEWEDGMVYHGTDRPASTWTKIAQWNISTKTFNFDKKPRIFPRFSSNKLSCVSDRHSTHILANRRLVAAALSLRLFSRRTCGWMDRYYYMRRQTKEKQIKCILSHLISGDGRCNNNNGVSPTQNHRPFDRILSINSCWIHCTLVDKRVDCILWMYFVI